MALIARIRIAPAARNAGWSVLKAKRKASQIAMNEPARIAPYRMAGDKESLPAAQTPNPIPAMARIARSAREENVLTV